MWNKLIYIRSETIWIYLWIWIVNKNECELKLCKWNSTLKLNWINGLNVNQLNVNNWYEIMNISVNSLKSNVIRSWIVE